MKKSTEILFVIILLLLAGTLRYTTWSSDVYSEDIFYHYTVVEQAVNNGELSNDNLLDQCYQGTTTGHPHGYYAPPYFLSKIFGLDVTFTFLPILLGILSLLFAYLFIKKLFTRKTALITLAFLSISIAHLSKSYPFSYRGDNLISPFLFLSLFFLTIFLFDHKRYAAILAGIISGVTVWFWNGYPLVIVIYYLSLVSCLLYMYLCKEKHFDTILKLSAASIISQTIIFYLIFFFIEISGKGLIFGQYYYPFIILGSILLLGTLYFSHKKKTHKYLLTFMLFGILIALFFTSQIQELLHGFGSIKRPVNLIQELQTPQPFQHFFFFHILLLTSLLGLFTFFKQFNAKKALFLGLLIPSVYLLSSALRYSYFAAIPLIALTGLFLDKKKIIKKRFDIFLFITITMFFLIFMYNFYAIPYFQEDRKPNYIFGTSDPYLYIKEHTESDACIFEPAIRGASIEFFSKRHAYFPSLADYSDRAINMSYFLMGTESYPFDIDHFYILLNYEDFTRINFYNLYAQYEDIGFLRLTYPEDATLDVTKKLPYKYAFINNKLYTNPQDIDCLYVHGDEHIILIQGVCESNLFKMLTNQPIQDFTNVYFKDGYSIYKYTPTSIHGKTESQELS